jgi:hypothetical protein
MSKGYPIHRKELRDFADAMAVIGWSWSMCKSGHLCWRHPGVPRAVFTASTPRRRDMVIERAKLMNAMRSAGCKP